MTIFLEGLKRKIEIGKTKSPSVSLNVNTLFDTPAKRMAAAVSGLNSSLYGRGNLIQAVEKGDGTVGFKTVLTGEIFDDINLAVNDVSKYGLADIRNLGVRVGSAMKKSRDLTDEYGAAEQFFANIKESLSNLSDSKKDILSRNGIDLDNLDSLQGHIMTMLKADSASDKGMLDRFAAAEKTGKLGGIFMPDDAGGRIFMFTQTDANGARIALDNYRTHLLLSVSGNSFYSANELDKIFQSTTADGLEDLASMIEKAGKRARAFLAPREVSLSGDVLEDVVKAFSSKFQTLSESTLFFDPQFEILTKFAADNDQSRFTSLLTAVAGGRNTPEGEIAQDIAFYHKNLDANQLVADINSGLRTQLDASQLDSLRRDVLDAHISMVNEGSTTKWNSERLKSKLESKYHNGTNERTFIENFFQSIEQSYDGADPGNKKFLDTYIRQIRDEVRDIEAQINSATNRVDKNQLIKLKNALEDKISRFERGDVYQITGRGRVRVPFLDKYLNIKNAMSFENEFEGRLAKYSSMISKFSLKDQVGIAGKEESLILSGIGKATDIVYADFVSTSFNPGLFIDPAELQRIRTHHEGLIRQFQESIDTGIIPEKVKNNLRRQASIDVEGLAIGDRQAAIRSKEYAQELLALMDSGVSVKDSPRMMNLLHKSFESMAFKEKAYKNESFYAPALPETHRFALDTERSMLGIKGVTDPIQLTGKDVFETLNIMGESGKNYEIRNISKFRISGHKALLPMQDVGKFYNALGGFDLDDKGIVRTITFGSEDDRMLGFYMYRQPSGPEEIIFYRMQMDQESIRGMFGHEAFQNKLKEIADREGGVYHEVQDIFASDTKRKYTGSEARRIENALANVAHELGDTYGISEKGLEILSRGGGNAATLMLEDLVDASGKAIIPAYTKPGIYRTLVENETFDFSEDLFSDLDRLSISNDIKTRLRATTSTEEAFEALRDLQMSNRGEEVSSIIGTIVDKMQRRKLAQQGGNLGTYVNRSSAASSILDQYSAYLGDADASVRDFLTGDIRYKAGLIAQETAIDASVNLSVSKKLHRDTATILTNAFQNIDEANLSKSLQKMYHLAKLSLDPDRPMATVTIDDIGQAAISSMGRIIGYSRATGSTVEGLEKGLGIDMFTLKNKLTDEDRRTLLDEIIAGMEEAQARMGTTVRQGFGDELAKYKGAADDETVLKVLSDHLGLTSESKWATIEGFNEIGRDSFKIMDTMYRKNIRRGAIDPVLQMTRSSIQEDALAGTFFDQYAEDIGQFYKIHGDKIRNMSEVEKYSYNIAKRQVSENILERIGTLSETTGITKSGLFNAMEKIGSEINFDLISLKDYNGDFGSDLATQTYNAIEKNRKLNRINYFLSRDQQNATQILGLLEGQAGTQTRVTVDNMKRFAEQLLNNSTSGVTELQENVLKALANRESEIQDSAAKRQANFEAAIIRQRFAAQELLEKEGRGIFDVSASNLEDEIDDVTSSLQRQGTRDISDIMQTMDLSERERNSIVQSLDPLAESSTSVKESIFKRFSLNEFKDLFKNKAFRTGAIAVTGLVVGSFIYSNMKTRNHEVSQSPPLLPAGSPYEENLPAPKVSLADLQNQGYQTGVSYNVNLYGNKNAIARFNQEAGKLGNANINTTIYNSIPNVSRDPYREIASSY